MIWVVKNMKNIISTLCYRIVKSMGDWRQIENTILQHTNGYLYIKLGDDTNEKN